MRSALTAAAHFATSVTSVVRFGRGHINDTFLVDTDGGELILQRVNAAVFPDPDAVMTNVLTVHGHLGGLMLPDPVRTRDGDWLVRVEQDAWRAWRRVPDAHPRPTPTVEAVRSAAHLLGMFHAALASLDPTSLETTLPHFHDVARRSAELEDVIARDERDRVSTVTEEIHVARSHRALAGLAFEFEQRVPRRIVHNDAKLDNVLFRGTDAVCLVDLDTVMPGAWFWDIGDLLRSASSTAAEDERDLTAVTVDRERYDAILDGYRAGAGSVLTPVEVEATEHAGAIVTYEQALRFLTDWLAGDVYYRTERPHQNLDRARVQLRLLTSMPGTVSAQ